jgi:hypothetical protein
MRQVRGGFEMVQVGDDVVIMSAPGRFRVIAVDGQTVTIENEHGLRKTVLQASIRTVEKPASH